MPQKSIAKLDMQMLHPIPIRLVTIGHKLENQVRRLLAECDAIAAASVAFVEAHPGVMATPQSQPTDFAQKLFADLRRTLHAG